MVEFARYLYAITRRISGDALAGITGIGGAPVAAVHHRDLTAIASEVTLREFGEEALRVNLEQLDWLERVARAHHSVVQAVSDVAPTAPLRLATICLDDDAVRDRLESWHEQLQHVLARVDGRLEWGVKVVAPPPAARRTEAATGGAEYLRRKRAVAADDRAAAQLATGAADAVHSVLSAAAVADQRLPAQDPKLSGRQGTMLLNAAYLVQRGEGGAFESLVQTMRDEHPEVAVDCQGPWPPYVFAMLDHDV